MVGQPSARAGAGEHDAREGKRRKMEAQGRFGNSRSPDRTHGIERFQVRIEEPFRLGQAVTGRGVRPTTRPVAEQAATTTRRRGRKRKSAFEVLADPETVAPAEEAAGSTTWAPTVEVTFHGTHVFAGIRSLVEAGAIDGERMPAWMTGEDSVSVGVVRGGRILGHKGSGIWPPP